VGEHGNQDDRDRIPKMKAKLIESGDFRVCFEANSLHRGKSGAVTAFIYWQFGDSCFPGPRWSDFVVVVLSWWIESLRGTDEGKLFRFMDGPFFMKVSGAGASSVRVECYEDRKEQKLVGSYQVPVKRIHGEIEAAAKAVVHALQERNWTSRDLEHLAKLLTSPWP
jgi:hypothetical protein